MVITVKMQSQSSEKRHALVCFQNGERFTEVQDVDFSTIRTKNMHKTPVVCAQKDFPASFRRLVPSRCSLALAGGLIMQTFPRFPRTRFPALAQHHMMFLYVLIGLLYVFADVTIGRLRSYVQQSARKIGEVSD